MIHAENLTRHFGALTAVDHLNLEIERGRDFRPGGSRRRGQNHHHAAAVRPDGSDRGQGDRRRHDVSRDLDAVKDQIGYMAQRFGLYSDLTVDENMTFYADLFGIIGREREELSTRLLRMTRMEPFRKRPAGKLSGGMKQKLALMCTLLHKPRVLFLDEPTNGVDPVSRRDFWAILYQLVRDGLTVFVTTAYLDEAERANRVGFMHQGQADPLRYSGGAEAQSDGAGVSDCSRTITARPCEILEKQPGVLTVQPAGADLHLFLDPNAHLAGKTVGGDAVRATSRSCRRSKMCSSRWCGRRRCPHAA